VKYDKVHSLTREIVETLLDRSIYESEKSKSKGTEKSKRKKQTDHDMLTILQQMEGKIRRFVEVEHVVLHTTVLDAQVWHYLKLFWGGAHSSKQNQQLNDLQRRMDGTSKVRTTGQMLERIIYIKKQINEKNQDVLEKTLQLLNLRMVHCDCTKRLPCMTVNMQYVYFFTDSFPLDFLDTRLSFIEDHDVAFAEINEIRKKIGENIKPPFVLRQYFRFEELAQSKIYYASWLLCEEVRKTKEKERVSMDRVRIIIRQTQRRNSNQSSNVGEVLLAEMDDNELAQLVQIFEVKPTTADRAEKILALSKMPIFFERTQLLGSSLGSLLPCYNNNLETTEDAALLVEEMKRIRALTLDRYTETNSGTASGKDNFATF
jgi:hypothetical protein